MSSITIHLSDGLNACVAEKSVQEEQRANFDAVAEKRYAGILAYGKTIPWHEMRRYLEARIAGNPERNHVE